MLVLTRKVNESIIIGESIEVMICQVRGDKVRLGITAPREVQVDRKEIFEQKRKEQNENGMSKSN